MPKKYVRRKEDPRIPLGRKPGSPAEAWWKLSRAARTRLKDYRGSGMSEFGGSPGSAPYWAVQEYGEPMAKIEAKHYIANALEMWRKDVAVLVRNWLRY